MRPVSPANPLPLDCGRAVEEVAQDLLGMILVHVKGERRCSGRIVECEAYGGVGEDACSHANRGRTPRNAAMFGPPGRLYVYFTYGMHHCANVVAHPPGRAGAVLLRALEPLDGLDIMHRRRRVDDDRYLCSGPARLVVAMGLGGRDNGRRLDSSRLFILDEGVRPVVEVAERVGVAGDDARTRWRFCVSGSRFLSRPV